MLEARVETIERALVGFERGNGDGAAREQALVEAHRLAGLLGTFGLGDGSALARELEHGLDGDPGPGRARRLGQAAAQLRRLLREAKVQSE